MTSNCITHNRMIHYSYVSGLNIITTQYVNISKIRTTRTTIFSELHFYCTKLLQLTYFQLHQSVSL